MNKYIRTKDGVFKVGIDKEAKESGVSNYYYIEVDKGVRLTFDEKELNKGRLGNTIEELCDCLIYIQPKHQPTLMLARNINYYLNDKNWKNSFIRNIKTGFKYYAAIWTDKGLIYVAKLNEKGKLELI